MFQSLDRVVYQVADLDRAKDWYSKLLDTEPVFTSPLIVIYRIGNSTLTLLPTENYSLQSNERVVAYWSVAEIDTAYHCMLDAGATLEFIKSNSPAGSLICFDYTADAPDMEERYGVKQTRESMKATYTTEQIQFKIDEGTVDSFLAERGFQIIEHLTPGAMEIKYLTLRDGTLAGKVVAHLCLVQAVVVK